MRADVFRSAIMGGLSNIVVESDTAFLGACEDEASEGDSSGIRDTFSPTRIAPPPPQRRSRFDLTPTPLIEVSLATAGTNRMNVGTVSPEQALKRFRDKFDGMRGAVDVESHLGSEVPSFYMLRDRLAYIEGAFRAVASGASRFSIAQRIHMFHFIAGLCDELDVGRAGREDLVMLTGLMKRLHMAMSDVEREQLEDCRPSREMALRVADTYLAYVLNGEYLRFRLGSGEERGLISEMKLATLVLRLLDVGQRYGLERYDSGIAAVYGFVRGVIRDEFLPDDSDQWALGLIFAFIERNASEWSMLIKSGHDARDVRRRMAIFALAMRDAMRALYRYSPSVFQRGERIMVEAGFGDMAYEFERRARIHKERAAKLRLL